VTKLTADLWRAELERAMRSAGDDGMSTREIREALGISISTATNMLSNLFRAGRIKSGRRMERARDGAMRPVPVYVIVKEKKR